MVSQTETTKLFTQIRTATFGRVLLFIFGVEALTTGCAHYPVNAKLEKYQPARITMGQALNAPTRADDLLMVMSFSGGGIRAAALANGVLEALNEVELPPRPASPVAEEKGRRFVQEVDLVTGVSGGSVTAASSSVPVPLGAITIRHYAGQCGFQDESWMAPALANPDFTSRAYRFAPQFNSYKDWNNKPFIHLVERGDQRQSRTEGLS